MGYFTRAEFVGGWKKLGCDSISKMVSRVSTFKDDITSENNFKDIYKFAFIFMKDDEKKRVVGSSNVALNRHSFSELESAIPMLKLVLEDRSHVDTFIEFLQKASPLNCSL